MPDNSKPPREPRKGIAIARWENEGGAPRQPGRPRDANRWVKRMVDAATGAVDDRGTTPDGRGKDPAAAALGRGKDRAGGGAKAKI